MVKLVGVFMVLLVGVGVAQLLTQNLQRRPRQLRAVRAMLQRLRSEMDYGLTPMPEVLRHLAREADEPMGLFATRVIEHVSHGASLRAAWQSALLDIDPVSALNDTDLETLRVLGHSLGTSHVDDQVRHLQLAMDRTERGLEEAIDRRDRDARLYTYLGVLASVALVIVLV